MSSVPFKVICCPACEHELRIQESYLGKPVRCPQCRQFFRAPELLADGTLGSAELLAPTARSKSAHDSGDSTLVAGLSLLLVAVMGFTVNGLQYMQIQQDEELYRENLRWQMIEGAEMVTVGRGQRPAMITAIGGLSVPAYVENLEKNVGPMYDLVMNKIPPARQWFLIVNLLSLFGAVSILSKRFYYVGVLGCCACMINLIDCCCLIGFPIGAYALVRILDPDIRKLFV